MTGIKGLVFDKDGTLFDFNATWGAWSAGLISEECGADSTLMHALADVLGFDLKTSSFQPGSVVIADTIEVVADHILTVIPGDKSALIDRMLRAATDAPQVPATDLPELLKALKSSGLKLGVATNDAEAPARAHLEHAGVAQEFDLILGYDSGHGGKPETGQLMAFCAATGLAPENCAMVGDSLHDLHAGRAAGMATVGVLTGPAPAEELAPFADVVLPSVADLPSWLDR